MNDPEEPEGEKAGAHKIIFSSLLLRTILSEENFSISIWAAYFGCNNKFIGHLHFQWELILWIFMNRMLLSPIFFFSLSIYVRIMWLISDSFVIQCSQYLAHILTTKWLRLGHFLKNEIEYEKLTLKIIISFLWLALVAPVSPVFYVLLFGPELLSDMVYDYGIWAGWKRGWWLLRLMM